MIDQISTALPLFDFIALCGTALVFLFPVTHRKNILFRYVLIAFLYLFAGALSVYYPFGYPINTVLEYFITLIAILFCADITAKEVIYHAVWIVVISKLFMAIYTMSGLWLDNILSLSLPLQAVIITLYIILFIYIFGISVARSLLLNHTFHLGPRQFSSALLLAVIFEILNYFLINTYFPSENLNLSALIVIGQFYCATVLFLQNALFSKSAIQEELDKLNYLWLHQKNQYKLSKENISLINRKCHDLRHQVSAIRTRSDSYDQDRYLKEIEDSINIYDSLVRTNNEALDTILTEKSLYCQSHNIQINCVADGARLNFISPVDIYTIFGNAMDNAIESVMKNGNRESRFIDVMIYRKSDMLIINVINPFDQVLDFEDDLPRSTKPDDGYHGFGLKSIRHTAEKYNGFATVDTRHASFTLSIVFPLPR